jgi:serine/threonine protein kinase/Tol biopolymer transport system component
MTPERWRQVTDVFQAALAHAPASRNAFLDDACRHDAGLRSEVDVLLAAHANADALDRPIAGVPVAAGARIGPYRLDALIGEGGMGQVFRAHDTTLGRDVAIKLLPPHLMSDPQRRARLAREARLLAALNHAHIAQVYGFEERDGAHALVMELVPGDTLGERIGAGLPVSHALTLARQIADALDAAHDKGIVHRDLKPANIKVTPAGDVKVLDFGLAKASTDSSGDDVDVARMPTVTATATRQGLILGTPAYMSPEQARGQRTDKRTDIWAFGCVLYEMLCGRGPFTRETMTDTLAAILGATPDWTALPASTPAAIRRLMHRCLEKDPQRRMRDIGDVRVDLDDDERDVAGGSERHAPAAREVAFRRLTDFVSVKESPALSPDGKMVAFVAFVDGRRQIWIRMVAGGAPLQLTRDAVDHLEPRWAPDSSTLIYHTPPARHGEPGTIWEISALGGWPRKIATAVGGGDISHDGRRLAVFQPAGDRLALVTVARDGSHGERIVLLPEGHTYLSPRWSPDDRAIALQRSSSTSVMVSLEIVTLTGDPAPRAVCQGPWIKGCCWLPDGSGLVYSSSAGSTLLYPPIFNLRAITADGRIDRQLTFGDQSYVDPDADRMGRLVATRIESASDIWQIPIDGAPEENVARAVRVTSQTGQVRTPSPSPDGSEVVYLSDSGGHGNLWVARTDGSGARQITFEQDPAVAIGVPRWSPVSDEIVFVVARGESIGLWLVRADGSDLRPFVTNGRGPCWSGDGQWLYYESVASGTPRIVKARIDGDAPVLLRQEPGATVPAIAADGSALYFTVTMRSSIFGNDRSDREIRRAQPEDGPGETLARVSGDRLPGLPAVLGIAVSPDHRWLATSLVDGATTNLWMLPARGGTMRRVTDFGGRSVEIARSISWSADSRSIYAAVAETETDIVLFEGLLS